MCIKFTGKKNNEIAEQSVPEATKVESTSEKAELDLATAQSSALVEDKASAENYACTLESPSVESPSVPEQVCESHGAFYIDIPSPSHHEDALPIVCDLVGDKPCFSESNGLKKGVMRLLLIADGLGGSGCAKIKLCRKFNKENFFDNTVGCEHGFEHVRSYFDNAFSDVYDELQKNETISRSNAYIASRIAACCVLGVLSSNGLNDASIFDAQNTKRTIGLFSEILKKINKLFDVVKQYADYHGVNESTSLVLPTTMALALLKNDGEYTDIVSIWAGDSRLYYLSNGGICLLSADEEAENSGITNLLHWVDENCDNLSKPHFCLSRYRLKSEGAVFACSDGFFQFQSFERQLSLLVFDAINSSQSFNEFKQKLINGVYVCRDDDISLAFSTLQADSFDVFKKNILTDNALSKIKLMAAVATYQNQKEILEKRYLDGVFTRLTEETRKNISKELIDNSPQYSELLSRFYANAEYPLKDNIGTIIRKYVCNTCSKDDKATFPCKECLKSSNIIQRLKNYLSVGTYNMIKDEYYRPVSPPLMISVEDRDNTTKALADIDANLKVEFEQSFATAISQELILQYDEFVSKQYEHLDKAEKTIIN